MISNRDETEESGSPYEEGMEPERFQDIEGTLREHISKDARLESGVPSEYRANELDFIQMTGITRRSSVSMASERNVSSQLRADDLDPSRPISFYEKGVTDVDSNSGPQALESPGEEPLPETFSRSTTSRPLDDLRSLVDDLARETGVSPPPPKHALSSVPGGFQGDAESSPLELDWGAQPSERTISAPDMIEPLSPGTPDSLQRELEIPSSFEPVPPVHEVPVPSGAEELAWAIPAAIEPPPRPAEPKEEIPEFVSAAIPETPSMSATVRPAKRLVEAEQLMQELEQQPRDLPPGLPLDMTPVRRTEALEDEEDGDDEEAASRKGRRGEARMGYEYSAAPTRRRRSRRHSYSMRRMVRLGLFLAAAACLSVGGVQVYKRYVSARIVSAEELWREAESRTASKQYDVASRLHQEYVRRFPSDPKAPESQFEAGFLLQLDRSGSKEAQERQLTDAALLLNEFVEKNPEAPKRARAVCLLGSIYCSLGRYTEAADLLRDPNRQHDDPDAALPILRTLALANLGMGNYDGAESAYLQAAVLPKNYTCDQDYRALGDMFRQRAEITTTDSEKKPYLETALKYWRMAVEISAMDPADRKQVQQQIDRTETESGAGEAAPKPESDTEDMSGAEAAPTPKAGAVDIEPPPGEERRQLSEDGQKTDEGPTP